MALLRLSESVVVADTQIRWVHRQPEMLHVWTVNQQLFVLHGNAASDLWLALVKLAANSWYPSDQEDAHGRAAL